MLPLQGEEVWTSETLVSYHNAIQIFRHHEGLKTCSTGSSFNTMTGLQAG